MEEPTPHDVDAAFLLLSKNTPSCSVQQRIKHTEELGETLQDGTKALGYKVT